MTTYGVINEYFRQKYLKGSRIKWVVYPAMTVLNLFDPVWNISRYIYVDM